MEASGCRYGSTTNQMEVAGLGHALATCATWPGKIYGLCESDLARKWTTGDYQYRAGKKEDYDEWCFRRTLIHRSASAYLERIERGFETELLHLPTFLHHSGVSSFWANDYVRERADDVGMRAVQAHKQNDTHTCVQPPAPWNQKDHPLPSEQPEDHRTQIRRIARNLPAYSQHAQNAKRKAEEIITDFFGHIETIFSYWSALTEGQITPSTFAVELEIPESTFLEKHISDLARMLEEQGFKNIRASRKLYNGNNIWTGYVLPEPDKGASVEKHPHILRKNKRIIPLVLTISPP